MKEELPIPGFPDYYATTDGEIISYQRNTRRVMKQKAQKNARQRKQISIYNTDGERRFLISHRLIASAKLGRELEPWEQVRHLDSDRNNNHMDNLAVGCAILNMIDDIENDPSDEPRIYQASYSAIRRVVIDGTIPPIPASLLVSLTLSNLASGQISA